MDDGTRLVVLIEPLGPAGADAPGRDPAGAARPTGPTGAPASSIEVTNTSRRVVRVSSHYPFERVNERLDVRSGGGRRLPARHRGRLDRALGAGRDADRAPRPRPVTPPLPRRAPRPLRADDRRSRPARRHGPVGPRRPRIARPAGDEPIWGYAKTLRPRSTQGRASPSELDAVVAGALVLDPVIGVVKADIGIKDGRIVGVGRAGNPGISDGHRAADRTAHAADHGLRPDRHARARSTATSTSSRPSCCRPRCRVASRRSSRPASRSRRGRWRGRWPAIDGWPVNVGLQACARAEDDGPLDALLEAGACGFKIHEDYGAYPELIDHVLRFADARDVSVALHTDGLHESAELEDTVAAIAGRTVHAYHVEGSGGGHVPDVIGLVREPNVICSSTTPTVPFGVDAAAEQVPMIVLNHGASFGVAEDVALVRERVHATTMAAEGPLHELGAIAIVNSDSQGMGRMMETVRRTFQLAHVMARLGGRRRRGRRSVDDTERVLRYLAKVTIEPAITHGIADHVGSLRPGRLADIVLWEPAYFGVKPALVLKGGHRGVGAAGRGQRHRSRAPSRRATGPTGAGLPRPAAALSVTFVSGSATGSPGRSRRHGRELIAVRGTRGLTRDVAGPEPGRRPDRGRRRATVGSRSTAGRSPSSRSREVPLSRRYLLR